MSDLNLSRKRAARMRPGGLLAWLLMASWPALVSPVRADNPPTYLFQFGSQGSGNGQFGSPNGVAVDSSLNIYVVDSPNYRVEKFDGNGIYLTQWGSLGTGNGQFQGPEGIAIDSSNNVYVTDYARVEKFDGNGNFLTQWNGVNVNDGPIKIAVDGSNNIEVLVYNSASADYLVEKFDGSGKNLTNWGYSFGPNGIATDTNNNVYTSDAGNDDVEKFDSNGNFLTKWGGPGTNNAQFEEPLCIAIDSSNDVYVADEGISGIKKFTSDGTYLTQWGGLGSGNGEFGYPGGIALDGSGNFVYVADTDNHRIQVFGNKTNIPPVITEQPASQSIPIDGNVTFSVGLLTAGFFGAETFYYQWTSNQVALANATNSTFTLNHVSPAEATAYAVLVTNNAGGTLSSNAVLTVVPALVTTLPATGISATNAVLNGLAMVGSDDTTLSFEWGTDTNYGNSIGTTVAPGGSGSTNLSVVLNGLAGNIYHYRLDASNALGVVEGNDVSFTVGFAPQVITTFQPTNSANGTTLSASVNPEGWDTTVYFMWGVSTGSPSNTTPGVDIGAGSTPVTVSATLNGLAKASLYNYKAIASNHLGTGYGAASIFLSPPFVNAPLKTWASIAASADGSKLIAAANGSEVPGGLYVSTNHGTTWTNAINSNATWQAVATSADGSRMIAAIGLPSAGSIYISSNSGTTFAPSPGAGVRVWNSLASSADGSRLAGASETTLISASTNSGVSWVPRTGFTNPLGFVASSADGVRLLAANAASIVGSLYTSTNAGTNWARATTAPSAQWNGVAASANGKQLLACSYPGYVYLSTDGGVNWAKTMLPMNNWNSVAESADGTKAVALANSGLPALGAGTGGIWTSTDSGNTWFSNNMPSAAWTSAAMSADGNEFVAAVGNPSTTGGIYVAQTTPAPVLSLAPVKGQSTISWIIPSMGFTLQRSPDLSNWTAVTNAPVLNDTNLENQVALPFPAGNIFYRLKSN